MSTEKVAWFCWTCGRVEAPKGDRYCPSCSNRMQRCSRYEWFLCDALKDELTKTGREYRIIEQYPISDHRGFTWYFDLFAWVAGKSMHGGYGELIEVNGMSHSNQKTYSGPGGGYTRDYDKYWEVSSQKFHKRGIETRNIDNEECSRKGGIVYQTAAKLAEELCHRADTWC